MPIATTVYNREIFNLVADTLNALATPILGAATTTNQVSTDAAYTEYAIVNAIVGAEHEIAKAICTGAGHGRKTAYLASDETTSSSPFTLHQRIGDFLEIQIKPTSGGNFQEGEPASSAIVSRFAASNNPLGLTLINGLYAVSDNVLWFTGYQAKIRYCMFTRPTLPTDAASLVTFLNTLADCPDEYQFLCAYLAIAKLLPKEGALVGAGGYYTQIAMQELQSLYGNKPPVATFQQYQETPR